jgi:hypothetical protein
MAVILLSIFTLGIYDLFWLVKVKKVLNQETDVHIPSIWVLFAPVIALVVGAIVAVAMSASSVSSGNTGGVTAITLVIELLAVVVIIPVTFYWFFKFSKAVGKYTHGELNTAMTFILLWILRFIGMAIIQDKFNDMLTAGPGATPAMAGPQPSIPGSPFTPQTPTVPSALAEPIAPETAVPQESPEATPPTDSNDQPPVPPTA